MNAARITELVDRGLAIIAERDRLATELKGIEAQLKKAGLEGEHRELKDAAREGRRFEARGTSAIVPVIFTADLLVKSFAADSATHRLIEAKAGGKLADFYQLMPTWQTRFDDGKVFREQADVLLAKDAPAFITACLQRGKGGIPKSQVKVEWKAGLADAGAAAQAGEEEE